MKNKPKNHNLNKIVFVIALFLFGVIFRTLYQFPYLLDFTKSDDRAKVIYFEENLSENNQMYENADIYIENLSVAGIENIQKNGNVSRYYDNDLDVGIVDIKLKDGWVLKEMLYKINGESNIEKYVESNGEDAFNFNIFQRKYPQNAINFDVGEEIIFGDISTQIFVIIQNEETEKQAMLAVEFLKYNEIKFDLSTMEINNTELYFETERYDEFSGNVIQEKWYMEYTNDLIENDVSRFNNPELLKECFNIGPMFMYLINDVENGAFEIDGDKLIVKFEKLIGVKVIEVITNGEVEKLL